MILKMFAVYDAKIKLYKEPFFLDHTGRALRGWETTVNDPKTEFHRYPEDFILYEIGEYDEETGMTKMYAERKSLGCAKDYKKNL